MVSLSSIRAQLNAYKPEPGTQANIKTALEVFINMEEQLPKEAAIQGIRDGFAPQLLCNPDVIKGPHNLFRYIRDYLVLQGLRCDPAEGTNRIIYGLSKMIYTTENEVQMAHNLLNFISAVPSSHHSQGSSSNSNRVISLHHNDKSKNYIEKQESTRLAHNVATRFRNENNFSGDINEDIKEYLSTSDYVCDDYELNENQKLTFLHNIFRG